MKKLMIIVGLLLGTGLGQTTHAQVNVQVNIGNQPVWGPTGYDHVDYYYLPDLDIYYYVPLQQWVYFNGGRWITTTVLPPQYSNYDLYRLHKVVINEKQPYLRNATYRANYASFKGRNDQQPIRDSRDQRYFVIKDHPQHNTVIAGNRAAQPNQPAGAQGRAGGSPNRNNRPDGHDGGSQRGNGNQGEGQRGNNGGPQGHRGN